jgi:hypothetical protein
VLPAGFTPAIAAAWTITPGHKGHYNYISPDGQLTVHSEEDAYYSGMKHNQPFGGRLGSTTTAKAHNNGVVLIVARSGGAGGVVNFVNFEPERMGDVVADELEVGATDQVLDVDLLAGEEVVEADDIVALVHHPFADMRTEEAGSACDENAFDFHRFIFQSTPLTKLSRE